MVGTARPSPQAGFREMATATATAGGKEAGRADRFLFINVHELLETETGHNIVTGLYGEQEERRAKAARPPM